MELHSQSPSNCSHNTLLSAIGACEIAHPRNVTNTAVTIYRFENSFTRVILQHVEVGVRLIDDFEKCWIDHEYGPIGQSAGIAGTTSKCWDDIVSNVRNFVIHYKMCAFVDDIFERIGFIHFVLGVAILLIKSMDEKLIRCLIQKNQLRLSTGTKRTTIEKAVNFQKKSIVRGSG